MTQPGSSRFNLLPFIVAGIVFLMGILLLGVAAWALMSGGIGVAEVTDTPRPVRTISIPTAAPTVATSTPTLTATMVATDVTPTNAPTATNLPPTSISPTNRPAVTNPPAPTNTSVPPTQNSARILNPGFSVESAAVPANQAIWFNFSVTNASPTAELFYGYLGAAIYKDGVRIHFQGSYSSASLLPGQTLNWRDHTEIGTPGTYQLQLSICYSAKDACNWPAGEWELLAQPVTVTIQ